MIIAPSLVLELLLGLGIALLLSRVLRGRPIITALLAIPPMVSPVMAAMAWRMMYRGQVRGHQQPRDGSSGSSTSTSTGSRRPSCPIVAVVLVEVWHNTPFMMLVLLAGLQSIPTGALRGGQSRRRQRLAALLVDHAAAAQVHDGGGRDDPAHRPHQAVRADLRADLRRARRQHGDGRLHDLPGGLQGLPDELRRGALVRHRRRRADPDALVFMWIQRVREARAA